MQQFINTGIVTLLLLALACTGDPDPQSTTVDNGALQDTLEQLITTAPPATPRYPGPDPFVGSYRNDPDVEGFLRQLEIDSAGVGSYRVRLTAAEISGESLCRHAATFDRIDTLVLRGRIEGNELRIRATAAALEISPTDVQLRANPGLLCPGASIFGWWLPQWFATADWTAPLAVPTRDKWLAPERLTQYNQAKSRAGQPGARLRYETEILTRGDYDRDGQWDYAALLRDTSGRRGLYLHHGPQTATRWERIADLTQFTPDSSLYYPPAGLSTLLPGQFPTGDRIVPTDIVRSTGILVRYYDSTAVYFYPEQQRWRRVELPRSADLN